MRAAPFVLAWLAVAGAGCSAPTYKDPFLGLNVRPDTIGDDGEEADVQVQATDAFGKPGKGTVFLSATHGLFSNGQGSIDLPLDSAGSAFTVFRCDARKDRDCFASVVLTGRWGYVPAEAGPPPADLESRRTVAITGCGFPEDAGRPPIVRACAPTTGSECDGPTDGFLSARGVALLNGAGGNGYDDDCDGLSDEGCACAAKGTTKDCWLLPATQRDPATGLPPGWCAANSRGSVDCSGSGAPVWSGVCRGAQPPADHDSCSAGDFNCDGLERNNDVAGCRCAIDLNCPEVPMSLAPFPNPRNLPQINGAAWLPDAGLAAATSNWRWTVVGGDCDNVLPNPTFALYRAKDALLQNARVGAKTRVFYDTSFDPPRYLVDPSSPVRAIRADGGNGSQGAIIYPAFSLSGDYLVQGEFDLGGTRYACTQRVEVRAPGIRAELCWDTVGNNDVDLHFTRLQDTACPTHGWNLICATDGGEDCFFDNAEPNWGYPSSPTSACVGWGSKSTSATCNNPRLDVDNIRCTTTVEDPTQSTFCSPENINVDNPRDGDRFAVGVLYYGSSAPVKLAHPHVNLYCNGQRVLSSGYNPLTGQLQVPALRTTGAITGDFWSVATITARVDGGALVACDVETIPARNGDPTRDGESGPDGGADFCVDSSQNQTPPPNTYNLTSERFIQNKRDGGQVGDAGDVPAFRGDWCRH